MPTFVKAYRKRGGIKVRAYTRSTTQTAARIYNKGEVALRKMEARSNRILEKTPGLVASRRMINGKPFHDLNQAHPKYPYMSKIARRSTSIMQAQATTWSVYQRKFNKSMGKSPSRAKKRSESSKRAWAVLNRAISRIK